MSSSREATRRRAGRAAATSGATGSSFTGSARQRDDVPTKYLSPLLVQAAPARSSASCAAIVHRGRRGRDAPPRSPHPRNRAHHARPLRVDHRQARHVGPDVPERALLRRRRRALPRPPGLGGRARRQGRSGGRSPARSTSCAASASTAATGARASAVPFLRFAVCRYAGIRHCPRRKASTSLRARSRRRAPTSRPRLRPPRSPARPTGSPRRPPRSALAPWLARERERVAEMLRLSRLREEETSKARRLAPCTRGPPCTIARRRRVGACSGGR